MDRACHQRCPPHRGRHALPRPPSPREPRMAGRRVGSVGKQSAREVLFAHAKGTRSAARRDEELDPLCRGDRRRAGRPGGSRMKRIPAWRRYLTFWRAPVEQDVDDELRFHANMRMQEFIARGMSEDDARLALTDRLGDVGAARAECVALNETRIRNARSAAFFDALRYDVRYACRGLVQRPAFAIAVVLTLALGFGANAAIFSVVARLLFRSPPMLRDVGRTNRVYVSYPEYDLKGRFVVDGLS